MTLTVESPHVYTQLGVAISVTGIAQVFLNIRNPWCIIVGFVEVHVLMIQETMVTKNIFVFGFSLCYISIWIWCDFWFRVAWRSCGYMCWCMVVVLFYRSWFNVNLLNRISLNTMTLTIESPQVYTQLGVAISVTGIAQVLVKIRNFSSCSPYIFQRWR